MHVHVAGCRHGGEVLDVLVQKRRNKTAALKLLRKLMKKQGYRPEKIVINGL